MYFIRVGGQLIVDFFLFLKMDLFVLWSDFQILGVCMG